MTDERDTPLTPAQDEEVRRLLADARHDEPLPPEVAARMDRVLDDLSAEPSRRAPVVDLAARRRRVSSLLVAAAAVVVVGIGIGQVGGGGDDDSPESSSAGDAGGVEAPELDSGADREAVPEEVAPEDGALAAEPGQIYSVNPDELSTDVEEIRRSATYRSQANGSLAEPRDFLLDGATCRAVDWGAGVLVPIQYGEQSGGLVFRQAKGDTQVADVYLCGDNTPVRSLTLPVP